MIPRYARPEMSALWAPERRLRIWLDVELAACEAMVKLGQVPAEDLAALRATFDGFAFGPAEVARVEEIERTTKHDVIAFLTFLEERGGPPARHLHKGLTSSDVLDTALAVQLREANALLLQGIDRVRAAVKRRALEHELTPMMGAATASTPSRSPSGSSSPAGTTPGVAAARRWSRPGEWWRWGSSPGRWEPSPASTRGSRRS